MDISIFYEKFTKECVIMIRNYVGENFIKKL